MKIAFVTDIHLEEPQVTGYGASPRKNWERLLDHIRASGPDMLIFGGDIGAASAHAYFAQSLKSFPGVRMVLGNHDRYGAVRESMPQFVRGNSTQSFTETIGGRKCLFLDSSTGSLDSRQLNLLAKTLDENVPIAIFIHHPVLPVTGYVDTHYPLGGREAIHRMINESNAEITIFCGHYHMADVRRSGNITQYITPAACYQIAKGVDKLIPDPTYFGYRIIELGNDIQTHCVIFDQ